MKLKYVLTLLSLFLVGFNINLQCDPLGWPIKAVFEQHLKDAGFDVGIVVDYLSTKWYSACAVGVLANDQHEVCPMDVALAVSNLIFYYKYSDYNPNILRFIKARRFGLVSTILFGRGRKEIDEAVCLLSSFSWS